MAITGINNISNDNEFYVITVWGAVKNPLIYVNKNTKNMTWGYPNFDDYLSIEERNNLKNQLEIYKDNINSIINSIV